MSDDTKGMYRKYSVRNLANERKHEGCEFFVLDWMHDKFAGPAIRAYADACIKEFPLLAEQLRVTAAYYEKRHAEGSLPPAAPQVTPRDEGGVT